MKPLYKKIVTIALLSVIAAVSLSACVPTNIQVDPVENEKFFTEALTYVWDEEVKNGSDFSLDKNIITPANLFSGMSYGRFLQTELRIKHSDYMNYEFEEISFTLTADRDVTVTVEVSYGAGLDDGLGEQEFTLYANVPSEAVFSFSPEKFTITKDNKKSLFIGFKGRPTETAEFRAWTKTEYKIEKFRVYGLDEIVVD